MQDGRPFDDDRVDSGVDGHLERGTPEVGGGEICYWMGDAGAELPAPQ